MRFKLDKSISLTDRVRFHPIGGSLNPARSLGPDVVAGQFASYTWIYYIAPYCATLFTTLFYKALVYFNYQTVVPDQDADEFGNTKQIIRDAYGNMIGALDNVPASAFGFLTAPQVDVEAQSIHVPPESVTNGGRGGVVESKTTYQPEWEDSYNQGGRAGGPLRKGSEATMYDNSYGNSSRQLAGQHKF